MVRPSQVNYGFAPQRIERLKATLGFRAIATSDKKGKARDEEVRLGKRIQQDILVLLADMDGSRIFHDRDEFRRKLEALFKGFIRFPDDFWDVLIDGLSEEDD